MPRASNPPEDELLNDADARISVSVTGQQDYAIGPIRTSSPYHLVREDV